MQELRCPCGAPLSGVRRPRGARPLERPSPHRQPHIIGNLPLHRRSGDEAPKISAFKEALGLDDEAAAPVFIEVRAAVSIWRACNELIRRIQK